MPGLLVVLLLGASACEGTAGSPDAGEGAPASRPTDAMAPAEGEASGLSLVDSTMVRAVAGEDGWNYVRAVESDLDSDGHAERVVLTARVELVRGRPAWDDGQPWQVYVEEADSTRSYLYGRFVQLGTVEMRVGVGEEGQLPSVVLLEHLPDRLAVYEAFYRGPGDLTITQRFRRRLDPTGQVASPVLP